MKRGFLNSSKAKRLSTAEAAYVPKDSQAKKVVSNLPTGKVPKVELSEAPKLKYKESDPLGGSVPGAMTITTIPIGADDDEPVTECVFVEGSKEVVMAIPNFPQPMLHPKEVAVRMSPVPGKGMGLLSTRALKMGDLILSERPLFICARYVSKYIPPGYTREMLAKHDMDEMEQCYGFAVNRMRPADKAAFMALANCHLEDGSGPIVGRVRTNVVRVSGLGPGATDETTEHYGAICRDISRLNHSCSPNTYQLWDLQSFSFRLHAVRDIAEGEELTFGYMDVLSNAAKRQTGLKPYGFVCTCASCNDPAASDPRRAAIKAYSPNVMVWVVDPNLPDDWLINQCLEQLEILTTEGLEHNQKYFYVTKAIMEAYICLGDAENTSKWAAKVCKQVWADEYAREPTGESAPLMDPKDIEAFEDHDMWRARVDPENKAVQMFKKFAAMTKPGNIKTLDGGYSFMTLTRPRNP
ncbi:ER lumen protein-retaining receptor [Favolaschia claudopus]|uniref:ER lumen protein-retaining receptor n=1 Tax=Favolaschia claudopus TaxID=2862362 RepID=A0AAW0EA80_9AGAR